MHEVYTLAAHENEKATACLWKCFPIGSKTQATNICYICENRKQLCAFIDLREYFIEPSYQVYTKPGVDDHGVWGSGVSTPPTIIGLPFQFLTMQEPDISYSARFKTILLSELRSGSDRSLIFRYGKSGFKIYCYK